MKYYVGLDVSLATTAICAVDESGAIIREGVAAAHLGLTPKKYASGETDRNGGISKCGDAAMRAVLYQSALALLPRSKKYPGIRVWGLGIAKRRGLRRAAVAVARKLAVLMHRIWADGTEYRWQREAAVEA